MAFAQMPCGCICGVRRERQTRQSLCLLCIQVPRHPRSSLRLFPLRAQPHQFNRERPSAATLAGDKSNSRRSDSCCARARLPAREPITSREPITTLPPPTLSDSTATFGAVLPTSPPLGPGRPGPGPHFTPMPPMPCTAPCTSPLPQSSPAPLAPMPPSHPTNPDFSPRRARMTGGPIDDREPLRRWRLREALAWPRLIFWSFNVFWFRATLAKGAASSAREQPPAQEPHGAAASPDLRCFYRSACVADRHRAS